MSKKLSTLLVAIAFLLSSVTAISVALAMYALIEDKNLALLFASAAVLLDVFKYLAWPVAIRVLRGASAALTIACALILSGVSGWATYDRLMTSINVSKATHEAMTTGRVNALVSLAKNDSALISQLDKEISDASAQANELRARGMVSRALELEESVGGRAASQRAQALTRINAGSLEIAHIKSGVAKASSLPPLLAQLLCLGFAMSLEIVPALILTGVRGARRSITHVVASEGSEKPLLDATTLPAEVSETPETSKTTETLPDSNAEILKTLVVHAKTLEPGTPVRLKEFAKNARIGNLRAGEIFRNAESLGVIRKTTIGYVTA
ncbi:hypothetical protein SAMN03159437_02620 [Pseudomonas sp. NFACC25]|uniref:hypothetical protein n=1 Tax=Pseudomonas sp. NFACC25 TaxID=1566188 RepID=UPI00087742B3|nr:hypothetical protein [Pseudomonas sp. NFACC25]SCX25035.1 hypothetical protein SAMN03159437_02620 [Pseudomonas sp. NFACC25]